MAKILMEITKTDTELLLGVTSSNAKSLQFTNSNLVLHFKRQIGISEMLWNHMKQ